MAEMQSDWACRARRFGILTLLTLALTACAVSGTRIKAYDGPDLSDAQTATLKAPENVKVIRINGQSMTSFLLDDLDLNFSLKPGTNRVVFKYRSIWAKSGVRENDESAVDVVESDLVEATFDARAGETYTFVVDEAETIREARSLARGFSARIVNGSGQVVARSVPHAAQQPAVAASSQPQAQPQAQPAAEVPASSAAAIPVAPSMSTLDALNLLWQRATREEKEAFLRQAFE